MMTRLHTRESPKINMLALRANIMDVQAGTSSYENQLRKSCSIYGEDDSVYYARQLVLLIVDLHGWL